MAAARTALPLAFALLSAMAGGCDAPPLLPACGPLPEPNGCPASAGGACADRTCAAIYSCGDGGWKLVERCSPLHADASPEGGPDADADADGPDAGDQPDCSMPDAPAATGCAPLQSPDCDAQLLDTCSAQACATGCEGFLRCQPDGWSTSYVAYCDADGVLHQNTAP